MHTPDTVLHMDVILPQPITRVKAELHAIVEGVQTTGTPVVVANHGKPAAVLVSWDDYLELQQRRVDPAGAAAT